MKKFTQILLVAAFSMTAYQGVSANNLQPWSGERPLFSDFNDPSGGGVNRSDVQAQAREAMANYAFRDGKNYHKALNRSTNSQGSSLSSEAVRAGGADAIRTGQIRVGDSD